jgi:hypothetical protein
MAIGNIKRGFNRLFVVFAVAWAIYCLTIFPLTEHAKADAHLREGMKGCYLTELGNGVSALNDCLKLSEQIWQPDQWGLMNFYKREWPLILAAIAGAPLLVYGIVRGMAFVSLWVWRGFRASPKVSQQ